MDSLAVDRQTVLAAACRASPALGRRGDDSNTSVIDLLVLADTMGMHVQGYYEAIGTGKLWGIFRTCRRLPSTMAQLRGFRRS